MWNAMSASPFGLFVILEEHPERFVFLRNRDITIITFVDAVQNQILNVVKMSQGFSSLIHPVVVLNKIKPVSTLFM